MHQNNKTQFKSITYSKHTLNTAGFVHKVKHKDKIKTVRIHSVEDTGAGAIRAYRDVAKSHIKNLRKRSLEGDGDAMPSNNEPLTRRSFFHDPTLKHALDPRNPFKEPTEEQQQQLKQQQLKQQEEGGAPTTPPVLDWDMLNFKPPRLMGLDIGTQYIGVSLSDPTMRFAEPYKVIDLKSTIAQNNTQSLIRNIQPDFRLKPQDVASQLNAIRRKYNIICTVVGMPESEHNQQINNKIANFTQNMKQLHGLGLGPYETCFVDEHHTTMLARRRVLQEEEEDQDYADRRAQYSHTGHGGERAKKLAQKSKQYDDSFQKKKSIDAEAAKLILERFIELLVPYGPEQSIEVQANFERAYPNGTSIHTV